MLPVPPQHLEADGLVVVVPRPQHRRRRDHARPEDVDRPKVVGLGREVEAGAVAGAVEGELVARAVDDLGVVGWVFSWSVGQSFVAGSELLYLAAGVKVNGYNIGSDDSIKAKQRRHPRATGLPAHLARDLVPVQGVRRARQVAQLAHRALPPRHRAPLRPHRQAGVGAEVPGVVEVDDGGVDQVERAHGAVVDDDLSGGDDVSLLGWVDRINWSAVLPIRQRHSETESTLSTQTD